ncbi:cytochrome c oxidase subunit II [Halobacterium wangiae]|uniref:cytochrome c oxidase subunit II n=1 Tax=Halobacterium wangiae TaxID=2902623 RepID=UPI001E32B2CB|nr:cytochrome c oxidase subunit II [Halobacterium wangiae]
MPILGAALRGVVLSPIVPRGTRSYVFEQIYVVFLVLGTLVGIVVIAYMLHKAYTYRASTRHGDDADRPTVGEIPSGSGGGRKLFVSFALSAIIVVSLISWTYFTLLYVESPDTAADEEPLEVDVVAHQFYWEFVYPNGHSERGTLRVPEDRRVRLTVTSADVFHNFGVPELRAKADAVPGERTDTWFEASSPGTYEAHCYELCGTGHSYMDATVQVMEQGAYEEWYANTSNGTAENGTTADASAPIASAAGV